MNTSFTLPNILKNILAQPLCIWIVGLLTIGYLDSCSGTSKLKEGQRLYVGARVKIDSKSKEKIKNEAALTTALEAVVTPQPNKSFFGIRPGVFFYNLGSDKGIGKFIRNTLGEAPVLYDSVNNKNITDLMVNRLHTNGYFTSTASYKPNLKPKTAEVVYTAHISKPYTIAKIDFPAGDSTNQVYRDIAATSAASLLKVGDIYNLANFTNERIRIDAALKNKGYFYFNPDYLIWKVDTTQNNYTLHVYLRIKPDAPERALVSYKLDEIKIDTDFSLGPDSSIMAPPIKVKGYTYFPDEESLKAKHLLPAVFIAPGKTYSRNDHALTLSRLMGFGMFRFVDLQFRQSDSVRQALDATIRLTPLQLQSMRAELEMTQQNLGFAGPGFNVRYNHRNLIRGGEQLSVNFNVAQQTFTGGGGRNDSTDTQTSGGKKGNGLNSFEFGVRAELNVPRFMTPFNLKNLHSQFVPRTRFTLGYNLLSRVNYFQMHGYNATYGYIWRPKPRITHEVTPVNIQYVQLTGVDSAFQKRLDRTPYLRRSFEQQFILGSIYNFTFNTQTQAKERTHFFFNANVDVSGNILNMFQKNILKSENDPNTLAKQAYAQYTRFAFDTRYYLALSPKSQLATRMIIGLGVPYGNSRNLPYVKQFFIGGSNSIRAFRPRELGPGTYMPKADTLASGYFDQTGDIKFETNVEYRFDIVPFVKGAFFVDAGNIWLARPDPEGETKREGGEFIPGKALSQLAIGTGAGIRIDADFFVLRFDLGVPLRDPYKKPSYVFTLPPARKSMVFHIAVGYPF